MMSFKFRYTTSRTPSGYCCRDFIEKKTPGKDYVPNPGGRKGNWKDKKPKETRDGDEKELGYQNDNLISHADQKTSEKIATETRT